VQQVLGHLAAVVRDPAQHLLVQPEVHLRGVLDVAGIAELLRQLAPLGQRMRDNRLPRMDMDTLLFRSTV